jgi:hypothetical protein
MHQKAQQLLPGQAELTHGLMQGAGDLPKLFRCLLCIDD